MKTWLQLLIVLCVISLVSCKGSNSTEPITDYSTPKHWLSLPIDNEKNVDIFYVYPTSWMKEDPSEPNICAIDNRIMLIGSQGAFDQQATAFETVGNIYAPYYRQADAYYSLSLPEYKRWELIDSIPAKDVTAAFDYYIKHYNNNRPFILVGHSQGAMILTLLLQNYMYENPEVYARMVSAYVIGYPVTVEYMAANKHLKFAEGADDTGVIISYNTQSPNIVAGGNILVTDTTGIVINPINWKRDETPATISENMGSYMPDSLGNYGIVANLADARIDIKQGVLVCSSVNEIAMHELSPVFAQGIYHSFDIPFYYYNLRENAQRRVNAFFSK